MADLTVRDIARHIQRRGESLTGAADRLRNWTDMGIVKAAGSKRPGTGRKRRYTGGALVEAVLLQALADGLGAPAISLRAIVQKIPASKIAANMILHGNLPAGGDAAEIIMVARAADETSIFVIGTADYIEKALTTTRLRSDIAVYILIDLRALFARLPKDLEPAVKDEMLEWARKIHSATTAKSWKQPSA